MNSKILIAVVSITFLITVSQVAYAFDIREIVSIFGNEEQRESKNVSDNEERGRYVEERGRNYEVTKRTNTASRNVIGSNTERSSRNIIKEITREKFGNMRENSLVNIFNAFPGLVTKGINIKQMTVVGNMQLNEVSLTSFEIDTSNNEKEYKVVLSAFITAFESNNELDTSAVVIENGKVTEKITPLELKIIFENYEQAKSWYELLLDSLRHPSEHGNVAFKKYGECEEESIEIPFTGGELKYHTCTIDLRKGGSVYIVLQH